jgi:hypothetical protein
LLEKAASERWLPVTTIMAKVIKRVESDSTDIPASEIVNIDYVKAFHDRVIYCCLFPEKEGYTSEFTTKVNAERHAKEVYVDKSTAKYYSFACFLVFGSKYTSTSLLFCEETGIYDFVMHRLSIVNIDYLRSWDVSAVGFYPLYDFGHYLEQGAM